MNFKINKLTFLLAGCFCGISFAQTAVPQTSKADEQPVALAETMVTATRTARTVNETPGASYVLTHEDLQSRNLTSIDNALNTIPGVFNRRGKGMMDTNAAISLRGVPDGRRTLVMRDGMPMNDGYNGVVNFGGLSANDFSRVEVALGSGASLYGNSAIGGVINYVSAMPKKREFKFNLGYGDGLGSDYAMRNLKRSYVSYGDKFDSGLSLFTSFTASGTLGYPVGLAQVIAKPVAGTTGWYETELPTGAKRYVVGQTGNNHWKEGGVTLRAAVDLPNNGEWRIGFNRNQYEYAHGTPATYVRNAAGQEVWGTYKTVSGKEELTLYSGLLAGAGKKVSDTYQTSLEMGVGTGRLRLNAGVNDTATNWYTLPGTTSATGLNGGKGTMSSTPNRMIYGDAQYTFSPFNRHLVVVGASLQMDKADGKKYNLTNWRDENSKSDIYETSGGKSRNVGLFVQDEISVTDKFTATLGFRWDRWQTEGYASYKVGGAMKSEQHPSRTQSALSSKLGLHYRVSDSLSLRSSLGKAFRAPSNFDLYNTWTYGSKVYKNNPELKPETAITWDIGADMRPWSGAELKTTVYLNQLKNMIYSRNVATGTVKENAGKARGYGFELDFRQKIGSDWTLLANAAFNKTRIQENAANVNSVGKQFKQVPARTANLGVEWIKGNWSAAGWVHHMSKRYDRDDNSDKVSGVYGSYDAYTIGNLKAGYRINKNLKLSLAVDNVFNKKYFANFRAPGRSYYLELAGEF